MSARSAVLKKWFVRGVSFTLVAASFIVTSASCVELTRSLENDSYLYSQATSRDLVEDIPSDSLSHITEAMRSLFVLAKSGLEAVRRHPLKALTMYLALQNNNSSFNMPSATALTVANINQSIITHNTIIPLPTYLFPLVINGTNNPCNATIVLGDINSGDLRSAFALPHDGANVPMPSFSVGVWNAYGDVVLLNQLLASLEFQPIVLSDSTIYLYPTIVDLMFPTNKVQGVIQLIPSTVTSSSPVTTPLPTPKNAITTLPPTSRTSIAMVPTMPNIAATSTLTTPAATSKNIATSTSKGTSTLRATSLSTEGSEVTSSFSTFNQNLNDGSVASSSISTEQMSHMTGITSPSSSDIASESLIIPASKPPYEVIVGATVGVAFSCGILATIVAYMRGWCGMRKKSSNALAHDHELGSQVSIENEVKSGVYAKIQVIHPQASNLGTYQASPVKSHYESHFCIVQGYEDIYFNLEKAVLGGACDLIDVFLDLGVPVDSVNDQGFTPLHLSVQAGEEDACKLLLRRGADKSLVTKDGKTALVLAQELGHTHLVALIGNS